MHRITIALVILGLTWLHSTNADFAQDVKNTNAKVSATLCSTTKPVPQAKIKNFAKCANNPVEIVNCRRKIYGYNFDSSANVAKACKTDSATDNKYFKCIESELNKRFADPNAPIRETQKCETKALGI